MVRSWSRSSGFTLPELLCTIGLIAVTVSWILPSVPVEELQLAEQVHGRPKVMRRFSVRTSGGAPQEHVLESALPPALRKAVTIVDLDHASSGRYFVVVWHSRQLKEKKPARLPSKAGSPKQAVRAATRAFGRLPDRSIMSAQSPEAEVSDGGRPRVRA